MEGKGRVKLLLENNESLLSTDEFISQSSKYALKGNMCRDYNKLIIKF